MIFIALCDRFCRQNFINQHELTLLQKETVQKYKHHRMSNEVHQHLVMENSPKSDARPTGVQLKREAELLTVIG